LKNLPRLDFDPKAKRAFGIRLIFLLIVNTAMVLSRLPKEVMKGNKQQNNRYPLYRAIFSGMRMKKMFPELMKKQARVMPLRFGDDVEFEYDGVLAGNAKKMKTKGGGEVPSNSSFTPAGAGFLSASTPTVTGTPPPPAPPPASKL